LDARLTTLLLKKFVTISRELKTECNLAEFFKEDCGSKRAVLPEMLMMRYL
jgi:hypothetical protein